MPAAQTYYEPARPLVDEGGATPSAQHEHDDLLDLADVAGRRVLHTAEGRRITLQPEQTAAALSNETVRPHARANSGTLVEVDKGKQLLFFVVDGRTEWILNTSTGDGQPYEEPDQNTPGEIARGISLTPSGLHNVNRQRPDGWWEGDLGKIYRPKYFVGGVAVHGSNSIPNYPASHGCVRVSVPAMDWIWDSGIMPMDIPVWVHDGG